jgi:hypothetical protein
VDQKLRQIQCEHSDAEENQSYQVKRPRKNEHQNPEHNALPSKNITKQVSFYRAFQGTPTGRFLRGGVEMIRSAFVRWAETLGLADCEAIKLSLAYCEAIKLSGVLFIDSKAMKVAVTSQRPAL